MNLKFKTIVFLFCLFTGTVTVAQDKSLILSAEENKEWMESLKAKNKLSQQLQSVRERIIADTAVSYSSSRFICYTGISDEKRKEIEAQEKAEKPDNKLYSRHRPIYQLVKNGEVIDISATIEGDQARKVVKFLSPEKVSSVEIYYNQPENVLYGVRGENGVILIKLKEKKTFQRLQQLLF